MTHPDAHHTPPAYLRSRRAALYEPPSGLALPAVAGATQLDTIRHCKAEDLLVSLPDGSVDLIVTSPPYDNLRAYKGFAWNFELIARESYRVLKPGGVLVWVVGDSVVEGSETLNCFEQAIYFKMQVGFKMHDTMIYSKPGVTFPDTRRYYQQFEYMFVLSKDVPKVANLQVKLNRWAGSTSWGDVTKRDKGDQLIWKGPKVVKEYGVMGNIWEMHGGKGFGTTDLEAYQHPAIFPETLAERHILTWSNPGDVVLDYFGGSGTTAKMARKNGRRYITCDISSEYCDLMRRRLAIPYTPMIPELLTA